MRAGFLCDAMGGCVMCSLINTIGRGFADSPGMNVFDVKLVQDGDWQRTKRGNGSRIAL